MGGSISWFTLAYAALLLLSCIIFFCGDWPIFQGTAIHSAYLCCTGGSFELVEKIVGIFCGDPGRHAVASIEHYCCERPNPILQLFYFTILFGTYYAVVTTSFVYIPGYYVSDIHRYLGTFGVIMAATWLLITSYSDPGTITAANVSDYVSMYPYDGILHEEKTCPTCNLVRPARSKHCGICGHCVARFDHHCGWTNTCIGENNLRFFIIFLFWHCCLTIYGSFVIGGILAGEVKKRNLVQLLTIYYGVEPSFWKLFPHITQWLAAFYSEQLLILLFLLVISLLLIGFLSYHLYLIITNTTTNETFKWENYKRRMMNSAVQNPVVMDMQKVKANNTGIADAPKRFKYTCSLISLFTRKSDTMTLCTEPLKRTNVYNKGFMGNFAEVFFPRACKLWCKGFRYFNKDKKS